MKLLTAVAAIVKRLAPPWSERPPRAWETDPEAAERMTARVASTDIPEHLCYHPPHYPDGKMIMSRTYTPYIPQTIGEIIDKLMGILGGLQLLRTKIFPRRISILSFSLSIRGWM